MTWYLCALFIVVLKAAEIDILECGVDIDISVHVGDIEHNIYPWMGILYYVYHGEYGEQRAITMVVLIQEEFVLAPASDIAPMPKRDFRQNSRVMLGHDWSKAGRKIRSYVIHPEYGETFNTLALVQLHQPVRDIWIKPVCPAPERLLNPDLYVIKFKEDYEHLEKEVIPVGHVPGEMCKDFYTKANLDMIRLRPPQVVCVSALEQDEVCAWDAGTALVTRDVWGRWQLLGLGTRGPGCGAPARYLDMLSYGPWVRDSLSKFRRLSISRIHKQKYVLRSSAKHMQRYGDCDDYEKNDNYLLYREVIVLRTDNMNYQFMTYNMSILQNVEFSCLTLELINASSTSDMTVHHYCKRPASGEPCYSYFASKFDISVFMMFADKCVFQMFAWGIEKQLELLDIMEWKHEEAIDYKEFSTESEEYKGPFWMTEFGFEPADEKVWVPLFDIWTTTIFENTTSISTTTREAIETAPEQIRYPKPYFEYEPTATPWYDRFTTTGVTMMTKKITTRFYKKKKFRRKSTTTEEPYYTTIAGGWLFPRWG